MTDKKTGRGKTEKGMKTFTGKRRGEEKKERNIHIEQDPASIVFSIFEPTLKVRKITPLL